MGDRTVAFTALADQGGNVGPNSADRTLVFNKTIASAGGGYDQTSGIFTAPVPGVYYFTFFYHADGQNESGLTLLKNGSLVVKAFDKSVAQSTDNAGNAAVLNLQQGDKVSVQLPANSSVWAADNATTFSGFLIREN